MDRAPNALAGRELEGAGQGRAPAREAPRPRLARTCFHNVVPLVRPPYPDDAVARSARELNRRRRLRHMDRGRKISFKCES